MRNLYGRTKSDSQHLKDHGASVLITNVCNLACGGCTVLCGTLKKESLFFISHEQFRVEVGIAARHHQVVALYGGEPTAHPDLEELLDICENEFPNNRFVVYTNGFKPFRERKNVGTRLDRKDRDFNQHFVATLVAGKDLVGIRSKEFYWQLARNRCAIYNDCAVQMCDGRAYICQVAASLEKLHGTNHGWPIEAGKDPFIRTDEEIAEQGRAFCHKCNYCKPGRHMQRQESKNPSVVTVENIGFVNPKHRPQLKENLRLKGRDLDPEVRQFAKGFILLQ